MDAGDAVAGEVAHRDCAGPAGGRPVRPPPVGYEKKTLATDKRGLVRQLGHQHVTVVGHDIGLMVAYGYAAQYPREVGKVVLMDAFLPGVGSWKDVWLLRDLWHFHFYGKTPLALVKGRERIYFEHFWNDFAGACARAGGCSGHARRRGSRQRGRGYAPGAFRSTAYARALTQRISF